MFSLARIAGIVGFGALLLLPFWAANRTVDVLFAPQAQSRLASATTMQALGDGVISRLDGVRAEIQADICSRNDRRYCLGTLCLPLSPAQGCARK